MRYIDGKFKEAKPKHTVAKIKKILGDLGVEVVETWYDSGVKNCYSLSLSTKCGIPSSNGKGITKDFARASAYGEFIERLQGGLFFYKFQSIGRDPEMKLQAYAPDAKYMTVEELVENGEWMDHIIDTYKDQNLTRATIARQCKMYACADDGKVLTLPFYSLFEKKYVYLPIDFVDQIYATNGCCVGNSREEAWVHALSEMMERHANLSIFTRGKAAPKFTEETINKFPVVSNIIKQIKESGDFEVDIFDYSQGDDFPIVSTRLIDKKTHSYRVNVAADPIFEIALQRTLTELFQGKNLRTVTAKHDGSILNSVNDFPITSNVINQLETSSGLYTADYFANEITCAERPRIFTDNSNKNNRELLDYILNIFIKKNQQIYVRNFSYLGFTCYRFVIPGFSEAYSVKLSEPVPEYAIADSICYAYKNPVNSSDDDLNMLLVHSDMIKATFGRYNFFSRISGVPINSWEQNAFLANFTRAYAAYRQKNYVKSINYLNTSIKNIKDEKNKEHLVCLKKYLELKNSNIADEKIKSIINKFFVKSIADNLFSSLTDGKTPFDQFLLKCDLKNCKNCNYANCCCYETSKELTKIVGNIYSTYSDGQSESIFALD